MTSGRQKERERSEMCSFVILHCTFLGTLVFDRADEIEDQLLHLVRFKLADANDIFVHGLVRGVVIPKALVGY